MFTLIIASHSYHCILPLVTSCWIPVTEISAFLMGLLFSSYTMPFIPWCTWNERNEGKHSMNLVVNLFCVVFFYKTNSGNVSVYLFFLSQMNKGHPVFMSCLTECKSPFTFVSCCSFWITVTRKSLPMFAQNQRRSRSSGSLDLCGLSCVCVCVSVQLKTIIYCYICVCSDLFYVWDQCFSVAQPLSGKCWCRGKFIAAQLQGDLKTVGVKVVKVLHS